MRIQLTNKHYDCTAFDCIYKYPGLIGNTHYIWVRNGRTLYEQAKNARGNKVKLRVVGDRVKHPWRYFDLDTEVELVPIGEERE